MRAQVRRARFGYRRTALIGLTSTAILLWGLGSASGQTAEAPAAPFSNGTAKATAVVVKVAPGIGSLQLALGSGVAVAEVKNRLGQAQAQALDLGLIGTTLTAGGCSDPVVRPEQLPQPTRVDNRKGPTQASSDEVPIADSTFGGGRESAWATAEPLAGAVATTVASFGDLVTVRGGRAEAVTEVVDGAARQAHATVEVGLGIAGLIDLSGLRWDAIHRTGKNPIAEASFDIGTARLLGIPIPLDSLAAMEKVINDALAPVGITIQFPKVERFTKPADLVRITPLRILLKDSPTGKAVLSPVLDVTREQRSQMFDTLSAAICEAAGALLVADIGVSIVGGTGFIVMEVGGAEATTGELVLENPFGGPTTPAPPVAPASGVTPVLPPAPAFVPAVPTAPATPAPRPAPVADVGPLEEICETIHPFSSPSCSEGAMAPLGLLGLIATVGVAGLDWRHQRRRLAPAVTEAPAAGA
jgi:hypothetical protein